ncbi:MULTISPECIES: sugar phosphate isomerase/epimerase [Modicisalibacter]|uniref:sugar phosphate isomerase/epimerase family protein n=1 Tax=Modicisalibacter TaxID=574347 RepID=UPI00100C2BE7|nr:MULTISPECIES: sugar phosphate isomerase/epimerase [Halomonadaceae]MBZ9559665.1 sugar phosphate isomerase/epimerase [Modicisalibacter sp. R2A 31.J]MBZ9577117.1 sugar phosphate isomerase/epimerase [Modicisalibacter sp. MOD 31.J]
MSVSGFGVHTAMWAMEWNREAAEFAIPEAVKHDIDFLEITMLDPEGVDTAHTRRLLEQAEVACVCSLGLPLDKLPTNNPEGALDFLTMAIDKSAEIGAKAMSGVIYGGIGQRTGQRPTEKEFDDTARVVARAAAYARSKGMLYGLEAVNRYENHLINTADQAVRLCEKVGAENVFVHLDTYHMNIEEKGIAQGILRAREHLKYIHLSASDRGTPGRDTIAWDEVFAALAAIDFKGGMAMESFITVPPQVASALSVWRDVAPSREEVLTDGLGYLRMKADQYGLI